MVNGLLCTIHLASELTTAWSHPITLFQVVAKNDQVTDQTLLLSQPTERADFYANGRVEDSVTKAITDELERV